MKNYQSLNPQKALIWRIIHCDNLPWILENGIFCGSSQTKAANWINIGNLELIDKRANHPVPLAPNGYLGDYVPFYFTPFSPMLYNIHTGRGGITQRTNEEIIILVSDLYHLASLGIPFLFTDGHAYYQWTKYYSDLSNLNKIDWEILQQRDFKRDQDDPEKFERYQAEALIYQHFPIKGLRGIICYNESQKQNIESIVQKQKLNLPVFIRPEWYFT
jgi:hypothetical protein